MLVASGSECLVCRSASVWCFGLASVWLRWSS